MLVDSLASSAKNTVVQLDNIHTTALETSRTSQQILSEQQEASEAARALLEQQLEAKRQLGDLQESTAASFSAANEAIHSASKASRLALDALKEDTEALGSKQRTLLGGVDRILDLQSALFGEFSDIKSILFFTCAVLLATALTSTARTAGARLPIFTVLAANCALEKLLSIIFLNRRGAQGSATDVEAMLSWLWMLRKTATAVAALLLLRAAVTYADLGRKAVAMLEDMQKVHRQHSDNLASKLDAIVAATSPAPSPIGPIAPNFALSVGVPPVATSQCASPSPADPTSTTGTQSPPCAPPPALISLPPDVVPFELFASVIRQRDVAHSLLRSSLARMRRRRSMSPAHLKAPALQPSECRRRSKSPLSRASPQSEHEGIVAAVDASCRRRAPTRTPPRRTSVTSICTGDEAPTPRRSQRLASRAERRRSVD